MPAVYGSPAVLPYVCAFAILSSSADIPPTVPSDGHATLLATAAESFGDLYPSESQLLAALDAGPRQSPKPGSLGPPSPDLVRAEFLRWLVANPEAVRNARAMRLVGVRVIGELDFSNLTLSCPILMTDCDIPSGLRLTDTKARSLALNSCRIGPVNLERAEIRGSLMIRSSTGVPAPSIVSGPLRLAHAHVSGGVDLSGTRIEGLEGDALIGDGMRVDGTVFLADQFSALGEVRLVRARIGDNLDCRGATLRAATADGAAGDYALSADYADIDGSVYLDAASNSQAFRSDGSVRLVGARIGGHLECHGGHFDGKGRSALTASFITVGGGVYMRAGFVANGGVIANNATIGGEVSCRQGRFAGPLALSLRASRINGALFLDAACFEGPVDLVRCTAGRLELNPTTIGDWSTNSVPFNLYRFTYDDLAGTESLQDYLAWLQLDSTAATKRFAYRQVADVLTSQGRREDATATLVALEEEITRRQGFVARLYRWVWGLLTGYGYHPRNALRGLVFMWIIGAVVFCVAQRRAMIVHTCSVPDGVPPPWNAERFSALVYALDTLVPLVDFGQRSHWRPIITRSRWSRAVWSYHRFHTAAGWVLSIALVVTVTALVQRST